MSGPVRLDLHVHSVFSPDSHLTVEEAIEQLGPAGLHGFALTDHNSTKGHAALRELAAKYPRYWLIPGVESTAREGHVLLYGVTEAPPRDLPLAELIEWASPRNAVVVLAHPLRWVHGVGRRIAERAKVHGLEGRNGRNGEVANLRTELLAAKRGLSATGGSDAHEPASLGRAFTELPSEVGSVEEILELLRTGRATVGGRSMPVGARFTTTFRNGLFRIGRGFRAV